MLELSGSSDEDLKKENMGDMKSARYYVTHGTCCWELFKVKGGKGASNVVGAALDITRNDNVIKSVHRVSC